MEKLMLSPEEQSDFRKMQLRFNHVAMSGGVIGMLGYSFIDYFISPALWIDFLAVRIVLAVLGIGLMTFSMVSKKAPQATFYAFWLPLLLFAGYGASLLSLPSQLLGWNIHLCFIVLFLANVAVSPQRWAWLFPLVGLGSYLLFFLVRPGVSFPEMAVNGGLLYAIGLLILPPLMLVRYRLYAQNVKLQRRIAAQNAELRDANDAKDRFFSLIAHDLKGPIGSAARVVNRLLEGEKGKPTEELEALGEAVNRSYALLENLLWWARSQRGELSVLPVELEVGNLVTRAWREIEAAAERKKISLEMDCDEAHSVVGDKKLMHTVIQNLLSNAVRFTEPGGRVTVASRRHNGRVTIEVRDTGKGMDTERVAKLFKIDEKQSDLSSDGERGSGLGLIVSKEFVEKNGGTIRVTSEPGKGSSFLIDLPSA